MKFTVQQKELLQALNISGRSIGKSTLPILDNYRFQISGNKALITGSSMEVFISKEITIESKIQSLDVCFTAKKLQTYIKGLADQPLQFNISAKTVKDKEQFSCEIKSTTGKCTIPLENGIDFPMTPIIDSGEIELPNHDLINAFEKTTFAVDTSPMKITSNVLIQFGNGIQVTGANPFYLSTVKAYNGTINLHSIIMPRTALDILTSFGDNGYVKVSYSDNHICFKTSDGTIVYSAISAGKYPDIKGFLEIKCDKHIYVNALEFKAALSRVILFADTLYKRIVITLSTDGLMLSGANESEQSAIENVNCIYSGDTFEIGVISDQMISVLSKIRSEKIYFSFSDYKKPILIKESDTESLDNVFLVIPSVLV